MREGTAYHEAGHAVMAFLLGVRVGKVTILPGKDYAGAAAIDERLVRFKYGEIDTSSQKRRNDLEKNCLILLAGPIAQHTFTQKGISFHADDDNSKIVACASALNGSPEATCEYIEKLELLVRSELASNWSLVENLAAELMARNEIDGDVWLRGRNPRTYRRRRTHTCP
jgi:hypothetical protein